MVDPTAQYLVRQTRLTCQGPVIDIVSATETGAALQFAPPTASPLIETRPVPNCERPPAGVSKWHVLGWAPQGLVVATPHHRRVIPLTEHAQPAGYSRALAANTPPPAPLHGARITSSGEIWIHETALGVLRVQGDQASLWRDTEWSNEVHPPLAAALSPNGERIAVLRGAKVWLLEKAAEP